MNRLEIRHGRDSWSLTTDWIGRCCPRRRNTAASAGCEPLQKGGSQIHHPGAHEVEFDVAVADQPADLLLNRTGPEATLPQVPVRPYPWLI